MLCLGEQIRCHIAGIRSLVRKDKDLAGACDRINADMAVHSLFRQSYVNVARAHDLIHFRDALRAVRKSGNRLGPACLVHFVRSGFLRRYQCGGRHLPVLSRGRYHNDLIHSCHLGRHDVHEDRRGIGCFSARHIDANSGKSGHLLSEDRAVRSAVEPAVLHLFLMIRTDIDERLSDHFDQAGIHRVICLLYLIFCHKNIRRIDFRAVKFFRIFKQRLISALLYSVKDHTHALFIFAVTVRAAL